jgi:uncharacterized membrane protein YhhN
MPSIVTVGLIAIPVLLFIAFVFGQYNPERTRRTLKPLRMSTSFVAVLIALVVWASNTRLAGAAPWFFFGMVFGFLGDLILADVIPLPKRMISGIIAFGVGHICYIIGVISVAAILGIGNPITGSLFWVVYVLASSFLWVVFINNPTKSRTLNIGSLIYSWLISLMAGAAGSLAIQDPRFTLTAVGGALFLVSDLILGNRELRDNGWFLVHDVVWVLYIAGQALIVTTSLRMIN